MTQRASTPAPAAADEGERIAKRIARAGVCSRRDAEKLIADGRVKVDGVVLTSPALDVKPHQVVLIDDQPLPATEPTRLWRYHKPAGLVTTHRDPEGRPTVFQHLPPELPRVLSVGRLDLTSEGLLLLTNDGELARRLELPKTGWVRRYKVRIHGLVNQAMLDRLAEGVTIDGISYGSIIAELEQVKGTNAWATFALKEGKNREIRRVVEYLGCRVTRLLRLAYGPFQLGLLARGAVEEVPAKVLRDQLGKSFTFAEPPAEPVRPVAKPGGKPPGKAGGRPNAKMANPSLTPPSGPRPARSAATPQSAPKATGRSRATTSATPGPVGPSSPSPRSQRPSSGPGGGGAKRRPPRS
ncbi:MAG: rRNA pseudouridine synthase [Alphaproteobacteria bacterium]|nr:MAG: rRNA pseudouridine synthase [Alphaproteobacteria bacterium]